MGIPFTHVDTSDSVEGWKARDIPSLGDIRSLGLITLGRFRSSTRGLAAKRRAVSISGGFAGRMALSPPLRGRGRAVGNVAPPAALSSLRSAGIADRRNGVAGTRASRCGCGFSPCGSSPARRTASVRWASSGCSVWAATRRPGPGCINCAGRWSALAAIASPVRSRRLDETYVGGPGTRVVAFDSLANAPSCAGASGRVRGLCRTRSR